MEIVQKTSEALGGLWLAFDVRERLVVVYVAAVALMLVAGLRAEAKRRDEGEQLVDRIVARLKEEFGE